MSNRTYRVTEIVGTSPDGIDQAIRNGIERASRTLRHLDWFEVTQIRERFDGDTTAPTIDETWREVATDPVSADSKSGWHTSRTGVEYRYVTYERR